MASGAYPIEIIRMLTGHYWSVKTFKCVATLVGRRFLSKLSNVLEGGSLETRKLRAIRFCRCTSHSILTVQEDIVHSSTIPCALDRQSVDNNDEPWACVAA